MKRFLILVCIFGPSVVIVFAVWVMRSVSAGHTAPENNTGHIALPAGALVQVRLVRKPCAADGPGDVRQAITSYPAILGQETLIPQGTRALVRILAIQKQPGGKADVTLQLEGLMSQGREIPIQSNVITVRLKCASDFEVMRRAAAGLIGGAVGAAVSAVVKNDPRLGAGAVGGVAAETGHQTQDGEILQFQVRDSIDLTGVRW
jgi:hypothetical protein